MHIPLGRLSIVENAGASETRSCLALCDAAVFVPMYGKGRSLNVHVSLAVVGYHLLHHSTYRVPVKEVG